MFNEYPYRNLTDLNLDFILNAIKEMRNEVTNFVSLNAIKYANPIQWSIIKQYEKNTIVIDPVSGIAYISVAPVPAGVALTRTEYWTIVFDLSEFIIKAAQNFTFRYEPDTTLTATFNSSVGDWIVWGEVLYKALVNITAGDQYVIGSNILRITIEDIVQNIYDYFHLYIGALNDLYTTNKTDIVSALNEVYTTMKAQDGDLTDLATSDKSNLVAAINEVLTTLRATAGDLNNLSTTNKSNLVAAINEVLTTLLTTAGDLNNLSTTNKSNLVAAINEVLSSLNSAVSAVYNRILTIDKLSTHKFLFIGDSYGTATYNWVDSFVNYGQIPSANYYNACVAGYGFNRGGHNGFLEELQTAHANISDPNAITDIVIIGGINDTDSSWSFGDELNAIVACSTYIDTYFPNAVVRIGFVGAMNYDSPLYTDPNNTQNNDMIPKVVECWKISGGFRWHYINNMENIFKWADNIGGDGLHPTANGANAIAICLVSSFVGVSTTVTHYIENTYATLVAGSGGEFSGTPTMTNYFMDNNVTSFDFNNVNLINFSHAPNTDIEVLSVTANLPQKGAKSVNTCCGTAQGFVALMDSNNVTRFKMCTFDCQFYAGKLHVFTTLINDAGTGYESDNITSINIPHIHLSGHTMLM